MLCTLTSPFVYLSGGVTRREGRGVLFALAFIRLNAWIPCNCFCTLSDRGAETAVMHIDGVRRMSVPYVHVSAPIPAQAHWHNGSPGCLLHASACIEAGLACMVRASREKCDTGHGLLLSHLCESWGNTVVQWDWRWSWAGLATFSVLSMLLWNQPHASLLLFGAVLHVVPLVIQLFTTAEG